MFFIRDNIGLAPFACKGHLDMGGCFRLFYGPGFLLCISSVAPDLVPGVDVLGGLALRQQEQRIGLNNSAVTWI